MTAEVYIEAGKIATTLGSLCLGGIILIVACVVVLAGIDIWRMMRS